MMAASMEQRIRDSFARQEFMRTIGGTLGSVVPGAVELRLPVHRGISQQHGFVHAGAVTALADTAAGYAVMSLLDEGVEVLSVEFKINLLEPARGDSLIARARVVRSGGRLSVSACDVFAVTDAGETCVATLLATIAHRRPGSPELKEHGADLDGVGPPVSEPRREAPRS